MLRWEFSSLVTFNLIMMKNAPFRNVRAILSKITRSMQYQPLLSNRNPAFSLRVKLPVLSFSDILTSSREK